LTPLKAEEESYWDLQCRWKDKIKLYFNQNICVEVSCSGQRLYNEWYYGNTLGSIILGS